MKPAATPPATAKKPADIAFCTYGRPAKKSSADQFRSHAGPRSDVDVHVRTKAEMAKPKSQFLMAPGEFARGPLRQRRRR